MPSATTVLLIYGLSVQHRLRPGTHLGFILFFVLVSAPAQEFLYRSFLFAQMDRVSYLGPLSKVTLSATLFSFMHLVYQNPITLIWTFLIGLLWASAFHYTRNLAVVALSHAAIGPIAIFFGVI